MELYKTRHILPYGFLNTKVGYGHLNRYGHEVIAKRLAKEIKHQLEMMFGFEFADNFNYPYLSKNVTEFWKRWHISLSSWLQEYLYYSLGGNRKGSFRTYLNLFLTMLLGGLWHGAAWTFVTTNYDLIYKRC